MSYNPVELFGKKPLFEKIDGIIYMFINCSKINKIRELGFKLYVKPGTLNYRVIVSDESHNYISSKEKLKVREIPSLCNNCPCLTISQFYNYINFCMKSFSKKPSYERFAAYLVSQNICKKDIKNLSHKLPQNRYRISTIAQDAEYGYNKSVAFFTRKGMNKILTNDDFEFEKYLKKFH